MLEAIKAAHPESFFGVAEFKDKPYYPLGEPDDFCYKLGDGKLSDSMDDFEWAYSGLYASGGGDLPEDSYQALINVALDPAVSWRPLAESNVPGDATYAGARLVIISGVSSELLKSSLTLYSNDMACSTLVGGRVSVEVFGTVQQRGNVSLSTRTLIAMKLHFLMLCIALLGKS
eukprot:Blabericola_migrator_1__2809@NODE_1802_length_3775_cov_446_658576_g1016_i1_p3_GENE_NODE_1802_length_3775_cov_446_658576_g1016_i1NODE_1802_length_3775_cov_446_658576_g1016_i1_p3_ORF_typecomplete_len174_score30_89Integrin_beta/PF00362_18/1_5e05_NODE_1802_length_3775_cov_446_658576_g1016_i1158679